MSVSELKANIAAVEARIRAAAGRAGRDPKKVKLVAVSKYARVQELRDAIEAGQLEFGENRAQDLKEKIEFLGSQASCCCWHFVGNLQRNKVKYIIGVVDLVHSVDRVSLLKTIDERAQGAGTRQRVLLQVNLQADESRAGFQPGELKEALRLSEECRSVAVEGLMTMAPLAEPEAARPYFKRLREIRDALQSEMPAARLGTLSMGMSNDFEVAVEEGASLVRVGTAVFGSQRSFGGQRGA